MRFFRVWRYFFRQKVLFFRFSRAVGVSYKQVFHTPKKPSPPPFAKKILRRSAVITSQARLYKPFPRYSFHSDNSPLPILIFSDPILPKTTWAIFSHFRSRKKSLWVKYKGKSIACRRIIFPVWKIGSPKFPKINFRHRIFLTEICKCVSLFFSQWKRNWNPISFSCPPERSKNRKNKYEVLFTKFLPKKENWNWNPFS